MTLRGSLERHTTRFSSTFGIVLAIVAVTAGLSVTAAGAAAAGTVRYHGYRFTVPAGWAVYDLAAHPRTCVRFDRHALYLGRPSADQRCPAHLAGRTEAVLVSPAAGVAGESPAARAAGAAGALGVIGSGGAVDTVALQSAGLVATVTWSHDRALVSRVVGRRVSVSALARFPARGRATRSFGATAHAAEAVYTGLGFDACSAPSTAAMSAWSRSPFRAVGVYIGGANSACAQPNLTPTWVADQVAAGWHLIPTYVGYQGGGSCGGSCAVISPDEATAEGAAAATDAVSRAAALGIPVGNPIYDDMEQYGRSVAHTAAVLAFLSSWTSTLHAAGYLSGVYSSASSVITDLVDQQETGYLEPDDIWIGDWNGQQTTGDPYVPTGEWDAQNRLHQYSGAHNDRYGGVTLNIDSDYVDGATADANDVAVPTIPDGTFVQVPGAVAVYRIAGDAPLYVSSWTPFGGPQPIDVISAAQFAALGPYPADGTFVQTTAGAVFRFAGGAPVAVSSWSVFGAAQPDVVIDQWDIDNAGNALAHVALTPADGTVVEGLPSMTYWTFDGGLRSPAPASATAIAVDDVGLDAFAQGASPTVGTVAGAGTVSPATPVSHCVVPHLKHMTLARARTALHRADCTVGTVRKPMTKLKAKRHVRHHTLHVFGQSAPPRSTHPVHYRVNLRLI